MISNVNPAVRRARTRAAARASWAVAATTLVAITAQAHQTRHGTLTIAHPYVALDAGCKGAPLRGYVMLVANEGRGDDRLVSAQLAGGASVRLVSPVTGATVDGVAVPAGGSVVVGPPNLAFEFARPRALPGEGGMLEGSLRFERAGVVPVQFMVEATHRGADPSALPCRGPATPTAASTPSAPAHRH